MSDAPPESPKDDNTRAVMQEIGRLVDDKLPDKWGFFVMAFPFNDAPGRMNYISNGGPRDILKIMQEFIQQNAPEMD